MTRGEIKEQLQAQYEAIRDIIQLDGVWYNTAFYAYLSSAEYAIGLALTRVNEVNQGDDGHE